MFSVHLTSSNEDTNYKMLDSIIPNVVAKKYIWFNDENEDQVFLINENHDFLFKKSCYKGDEFLQTLNSAMYYVVSVQLTALDHTLESGRILESENKKIQIKIEDGKYVEILSDNKEDAELFFQNALSKNFNTVSIYKT
jgi:hypothetical protein